jgi:hypothetical protein
LKPEWWGSPLVQEEKYQKKTCEKRIRNNNNNNSNNNVLHTFFKLLLTLTGSLVAMSSHLFGAVRSKRLKTEERC